jgi:quinol monooxygenase YgiN
MKISNHLYRKAIQASLRILGCCGVLLLSVLHTQAQTDKRMIRLAKIEVDPAQLEEYNAALKEQMQTAIRLEPGVLTYYAVADKKDLSRITILEIYADTAAYQKHIATPHFKKYKTTVEHMVKKLELVDVNLICSAKQPGL